MPLSGEYAPGTAEWARTQAEAYEAKWHEKDKERYHHERLP